MGRKLKAFKRGMGRLLAGVDRAKPARTITSSADLRVGDIVHVVTTHTTFQAEIASIEGGWVQTADGFGYSTSHIDQMLSSGQVEITILLPASRRALPKPAERTIESSSDLRVGDVVAVTTGFGTFHAEVDTIGLDRILTTDGDSYRRSYIDLLLSPAGGVKVSLLSAAEAKALKGY